MQAFQCLSYRSLQERRKGLEVLQNLLKQGEKENEGEEKKEDDDDDDNMEGKRRYEEDIKDSRVVQGAGQKNSPWSQLPLLQLLLQGFIQQEEVKKLFLKVNLRTNYLLNFRHVQKVRSHFFLQKYCCNYVCDFHIFHEVYSKRKYICTLRKEKGFFLWILM